MIAFAIQYALSLRSLSDTEKVLISLVGAAVIVMAGSFLWHLIATPAVLHRNQIGRIAELERSLEEARESRDALTTRPEISVSVDRGTLQQAHATSTGYRGDRLVKEVWVCITLIVTFLNKRPCAASVDRCSLEIQTPLRTIAAKLLSEVSDVGALGFPPITKPLTTPEMEANVALQQGIAATRYVQFLAEVWKDDHLDTEAQLILSAINSFGGQSHATFASANLTTINSPPFKIETW